MQSWSEKKSRWFKIRLSSYPRALIVFYAASILVLLISAARSPYGLTDLMGYPLGRDFSCYWLASSLALSGSTGLVYNFSEFLAAHQDYFHTSLGLPWVYAPTFLLLVYPFALLPYLLSLAVWLGSTLGACLIMVRRIAPHPLTARLVLAWPATFINIIYGQNGLLSTAILGGGLLLLERFPLWGGMVLGLMSYKPQFFPLIPLALVAGRQWKALLGLLIGAVGLIAASFLAFGMAIWFDFFQSSGNFLKLFESRLVPIHKMITFFAGTLHYSAAPGLAWVVQGGVSLGVAGLVAYIWHRPTPFYLRASALVVGIILATPYAYPYDLAMLMLPLAWLGWEGFTAGWIPWEPELLFFTWLSPLFMVSLNFTGLNFLPPLMLCIFLVLVLRRVQLVRLRALPEVR